MLSQSTFKQMGSGGAPGLCFAVIQGEDSDGRGMDPFSAGTVPLSPHLLVSLPGSPPRCAGHQLGHGDTAAAGGGFSVHTRGPGIVL